MDVKNKTIKIAEVFCSIDKARSILNAIEKQAEAYAAGGSCDLQGLVDLCLKLKEERERILVSFIESAAAVPANGKTDE
ncbi:hypothetical protein [Sutterella wadsworthensis]|jgi:hypothetical protein|uniref:hypothetical protein n=1 Tax=Sutterella wadsworthensis TaxID=40545 RepID=UPI0013F69787|nr:hypothetical protein [Sutterella wadsworthensis]